MNNTFKTISLLGTMIFCSIGMADLPIEEAGDISAQGDFSGLPTDIADVSAQGGLTDLPTEIADVSAQSGLAELPTEIADVSAQSGMGAGLENSIENLSEFPNLHEAMDNNEDHSLDGLMLTRSENLLKLKEAK